MHNEDELKDKITVLTTRIREQYPELSVYLAKLRVTMTDEKDAEVSRARLQEYYDTLMSVLTKYVVEYPANSESKV